MRMFRGTTGWLTFTAILVLSVAPATGWQTDAYFAERIWPGDGPAIEDGVLVTSDGKIVAVGPRGEVQVPQAARLHNLSGQVIIPGLIAAQTNLTGSNDVEKTLTPQIKAVDGFDFYADRSEALAGGVTTVQISPGDDRLMPGLGAVVKLDGAADHPLQRVLSANESLRVVLDDSTRNPPRIYEPPVGPVSVDRPLLPTRPQLSKSLVGALGGLRLIFKNATAQQQYVSTVPDEIIDAVTDHLSKRRPIRFTATSLPEIQGALNLGNEFGLPLLLVDCLDLELLQDDLQRWRGRVRGVVLPGLTPGKIDNPSPEAAEKQSLPWEYVRELIDAGIPVAVRPAVDADLAELMFVTGQFRQDGLNQQETLSMLTRWPAQMLGVSQRVGSLANGKDADFVVLSNDPFQLRTHVVATYVEGNRVYTRARVAATTIIRAGKIYTGDGQMHDQASLVVKGKTIRGVGPDVSAPLDAKIKTFDDAVVVPGFVDLGSSLGIGGNLTGNISLQTKLGEQLDADDPAIEMARKSGVTTVLLGALTSSQPTPLVAFKLGDDARVVADPVAIRFRIGDQPATAVPQLERTLKRGKAYYDSWIKYEQALAEFKAKKAAEPVEKTEDKKADDEKDEKDSEKTAGDDSEKDTQQTNRSRRRPGTTDESQRRRRPPAETDDQKQDDAKQQEEEKADDSEKDAAKAESEPEPPKPPQKQDSLEPYRALFAGNIPALVEARRADAIQAALKLFRETYQLELILVGADDLARVPDLLDGHDVSVCAGPKLIVDIDNQQTNLPVWLANQQVRFGFQSAGRTGVSQLPAAVQFAVNQGLGVQDGLQAMTSSAAAMFQEKLPVGTLAEGKDADLVVLSGQPFEFSTKVLAVMIDGKWVYEREDE